MKVLKFGGGCLKDSKSIKRLPSILKEYDNDIVIVISAFGKLTNQLEKIYLSQKKSFDSIILFFKDIMCDLQFSKQLTDSILSKLLKLCSEKPILEPQILSIGELISSNIISEYLKHIYINHTLLSAPDFIKTIDKGMNAIVDWNQTLNKMNSRKLKFLKKEMWPIITQGFIAGYNSNKNLAITCLGREGSDYSAAIFGRIFDADEVVLFKDVDGIYSSDPKKNSDAKLFSQLTYAKAEKLFDNKNTVVHSKTISLLKEKNIPIIIKNFNDLDKDGTIIN